MVKKRHERGALAGARLSAAPGDERSGVQLLFLASIQATEIVPSMQKFMTQPGNQTQKWGQTATN